MTVCRRCGQCCWDWKGNNREAKCEHLADDMVTCLIYGRRAEFNRAECDRLMEVHQAVDLHPDCGYMVVWKAAGLVP